MKGSRALVGGSYRGLLRSRAVTLRGVRALLSTIFQTAPPPATTAAQGVALDYSDLTDDKLAWRRNLLTETEFRNGINTDAPVKGGSVTNATLAGYAGAVQFVSDATGSYAYKNYSAVVGARYVLSVIVAMNDGLAPAFAGGDSASVGNDFVLVAKGDATGPGTYTVTALGGGLYRVALPPYLVSGSGLSNWGVVKYAANSTRGFKVTAYQLERSLVMTAYQPMTDVATEFLAAFPLHALYQDHVGNVPVWDKEQPIGMALDMRLGGLRGAEVNPDPGFNNPAAWNTAGGSPGWVVSNGVAACTATAGANRWVASTLGSLVVGRWYEIYADIVVTAGSTVPDVSAYPVYANKTGRWHWILQATTTTLQFMAPPAFIGSIDNVSFREVSGAHAIQPTVGDRPTLNGRTNLFIASQLDQIIAAGSAPPTIQNKTFAYGEFCASATFTPAMPAGYGSSRLEASSTTTAPIISGTTYTWGYRIALSRALVGSESFYCYVTGGAGMAQVIIDASNCAPYVGKFGLVTASSVPPSNGSIYPVVFVNGAMTSNMVLSICRAQFNPGTQLAPYQHVATATDYDPIGFPKGAKFNGTNSWMSIAALDLSGSDKVGAAASIRRDSDASTAVVMEHSADASANAGTFGLFAPGSGGASNLGMRAMGSSATVGFSSAVPTPAPALTITAAQIDFGNVVLILRRDGGFLATNTTPLGAGNFTSRPFFIGRRGGTSLAFNGVIYRLAVRGGASDNFIPIMERWVNDPVRVLS